MVLINLTPSFVSITELCSTFSFTLPLYSVSTFVHIHGTLCEIVKVILWWVYFTWNYLTAN